MRPERHVENAWELRSGLPGRDVREPDSGPNENIYVCVPSPIVE